MNDPAQFWADPRLVYTVAATAAALLVATIWLFRRRRRHGRQAGLICLLLSVALHLSLVFLVPLLPGPSGGSVNADPTSEADPGTDAISFSTFDPELDATTAAGQDDPALIKPLPVSNLTDLLNPPQRTSAVVAVDPELTAEPETVAAEETCPADEPAEQPQPQPEPDAVASVADLVPASLAVAPSDPAAQWMNEIDSQIGDWIDQAVAPAAPPAMASISDEPPAAAETAPPMPSEAATPSEPPITAAVQPVADAVPATSASATAPSGTVAGGRENDFANRVGQAKQHAIERTGGDTNSEAAVEAALKFLTLAQRSDGAWDPRSSGAGVERSPLGTSRGGAGARAETAITGLALLSLMGAGHTHQQGDYAENVYRGLAYLIRHQKPDGSLAGNASVYEATYCHGMAALAMCEAAAMTGDASALDSAGRALQFTRRMQHPSTGGWRYTEGDPGDLSQLGWQAMVLDAGYRANLPVDGRSVAGVERFLHSVRAGSQGGLASYRPGEAVSRTMTAEALATRLLIGQQVPPAQIAEAQRYLLGQPPGVGQDNYYYWYYATLALHQLQDDAWQQWNTALKNRLLSTQRSDGSWSSDTVWGGYGGTIYTTSMATLCLEVYYRHAIRSDNDRIARQPTR